MVTGSDRSNHRGGVDMLIVRRRIRVWLGEHVIVDYVAAPDPRPDLPTDPAPLDYTGPDGAL